MRPELILWDWNGTLLDDVAPLRGRAQPSAGTITAIRSGTTAISTGQFLVFPYRGILRPRWV